MVREPDPKEVVAPPIMLRTQVAVGARAETMPEGRSTAPVGGNVDKTATGRASTLGNGTVGRRLVAPARRGRLVLLQLR